MTTFPMVNINGTVAGQLLFQQRNVADKLRELKKAYIDAAPHGRDYQTAPEGTYEQARQEHYEKQAQLNEMLNDAIAIAMHVSK